MLIAAALPLAAQVNPQLEARALTEWREHRPQDANNTFRQLVKENPGNPGYRVEWGRFYLDRAQPAEAAALFQEALEIHPDHAGALLGLALVAARDFNGSAIDLARNALKADPKLVEAQELIARLELEDSHSTRAAEEAHKALALASNSVQARAILATIDWLAGRTDSSFDPHAAAGYETAGRLFVLNRRYEEGIAFYRKAIGLDPELWSARSQLGVNLMRLGEHEEAYKLLEECYHNGFQDEQTVNSLRLMDKYKDFVTFTTPRTILKIDKREAALLHPYIEAEMLRAIATYEKKYRMHLDRPVQVEVYRNHEDFAVRTLGMPGLGALGVTFGYVVAMDSPSGRKPGDFHWASTLWHELSHVFTLTATGHKVPRWFTEGMAVHEETAVSPEWGDRLSPDVLAAIRDKKLLPVAELDRGFIHPTTPHQVIVSYFQAGRICDFITAEWGETRLLDMLKDFARGDATADVITRELKIEPAEFDRRFFARVEADTRKQVAGFDDWRKRLKGLVELGKQKDYDAIIREGKSIRDEYPDYVETGSVYEYLAEAYLAKKDTASAIAVLESYAHMGGRNPETLKLLATSLEDAGRKTDAAAALDRINFIYPVDPVVHQRLGALWLDLGNPAGAVREYQAVIAGGPLDPAAAHYNLARALRAANQLDQARDELVLALETAPGYRPAQKMLLELSKQD